MVNKMIEQITNHIKNNLIDPGRPWPAKRVICKDGFNLSVQANEYAYCTPRNSTGPWTQVEVGFPSEPQELFEEYYDGDICSYIPIEIVAQVIINHGGFADE